MSAERDAAPTPTLRIEHDGSRVVLMAGDQTLAVCGYTNDPRAEEDSAEIVRRYNAHAALVECREALRRATNDLRSAYYDIIREREGIRDHDEIADRVEREPNIKAFVAALAACAAAEGGASR